MTEQLRLTQALVDRLPPFTDCRGPVTIEEPGHHYHRRTAEAVLKRLAQPNTLWVFAAGSLMWNPRFPVVERRTAYVTGWRRSFCLADTRYRGSPSAPGLMMSLDREGSCAGVVMRMHPKHLRSALVALLETEPPIPPEFVEAWTSEGPVEAILFAANPEWPLYRPEPEAGQLADILASAVGHIGTMAEYLFKTVRGLEEMGLNDHHLGRLQSLVADRLEQLPSRAVRRAGSHSILQTARQVCAEARDSASIRSALPLKVDFKTELAGPSLSTQAGLRDC